MRSGSNLYTNSIVILDAKTGIYRNHYSLVPADFHDWDLSAAPVLVTTKGGKRIVAGAPKDGLLHVYDLTTDKKLYATPITTRENDEMPLSTKPTRFCPGRGRRDRMERAGLQPRHKSALHRHRGLVRDGDARSERARKRSQGKRGPVPSSRRNSARATSIGQDGSPRPMPTPDK